MGREQSGKARRPRQTTIRLPEELSQRTKHKAIDERTTMGKVIEQALREYLAKK